MTSDTFTKRMILFLVGCMGSRLLLVYIAKNISIDNLYYMGYLALIPAAGFLWIYSTGARTTGPEVFGEKIWWNHLRPVHAALYLLFAASAIHGYKDAWLFLLIDVVIGFISFMNHHFF